MVYQFMIERGGDFLGRDCLYLALTYFDRSIAASIHLGKLLEMPYFTETVPYMLRVKRQWPAATSIDNLRAMRWTYRSD